MTNSRAKALVMQIRAGNEAAFTELYNGCYGLVFGICIKIVEDRGTAEDTASEVFVKVWNKLDKYDPAKGGFLAWLSLVARNSAIDKVRRRKTKIIPRLFTEAEIESETDLQVVDNAISVLDTFIEEEFVGIVETALKQVKQPHYAQCFRLQNLEGYSIREISEETGLKEPTVKIAIYRAKAQLRQIILLAYPELRELLPQK